MFDSHWLALSFTAPEHAVDDVSDMLMEAGALSVDVADADAGTEAERAIFREPNEASALRWTHNRITALFDSGHERDALLALVPACSNAHAFTPTSVRIAQVDEQDWVRLTQSQFAPIEIEPALWIVPTWCEPPRADALNLILDPGMAFGTGSHPTTALCLRWLSRGAHAGWLTNQDVLDYGCGSGILGIAAKRLGAAQVIGTDIDAHALEVARENAQRNGAASVRWPLPDGVPARPFPVVVANILANPLCVLAPLLCGHLAQHGRIALSGILREQVEKVRAAYAPWVALQVEHELDGWQLMTGVRA